MQQTMKKFQHVTVHQYMSRMGVLNEYLACVHMGYDLSMAVEGTKKKNVPFDEADLARIMLNSVPVTWMIQYNMIHSMLPKSPCVLLLNLEALSKVMNEEHQSNLKIKAKEASIASASTKGMLCIGGGR
jgi:hypothetical protein